MDDHLPSCMNVFHRAVEPPETPTRSCAGGEVGFPPEIPLVWTCAAKDDPPPVPVPDDFMRRSCGPAECIRSIAMSLGPIDRKPFPDGTPAVDVAENLGPLGWFFWDPVYAHLDWLFGLAADLIESNPNGVGWAICLVYGSGFQNATHNHRPFPDFRERIAECAWIFPSGAPPPVSGNDLYVGVLGVVRRHGKESRFRVRVTVDSPDPDGMSLGAMRWTCSARTCRDSGPMCLSVPLEVFTAPMGMNDALANWSVLAQKSQRVSLTATERTKMCCTVAWVAGLMFHEILHQQCAPLIEGYPAAHQPERCDWHYLASSVFYRGARAG